MPRRPVSDPPVDVITPLPVPPTLQADAVAAQEWARLAPLLQRTGVLTESNLRAFEMLCRHWSLYVAAHERLQQDGPILKVARGGYLVQHPAFTIAEKSTRLYLLLAARLGLARVSRRVVPSMNLSETERLDAFLTN
jgi:P27 family predicted phage terminase small subunit